MPVFLQVANEAAIGKVLHHQTHTEATCKQVTIKFWVLFIVLNYVSMHPLDILQDFS